MVWLESCNSLKDFEDSLFLLPLHFGQVERNHETYETETLPASVFTLFWTERGVRGCQWLNPYEESWEKYNVASDYV